MARTEQILRRRWAVLASAGLLVVVVLALVLGSGSDDEEPTPTAQPTAGHQEQSPQGREIAVRAAGIGIEVPRGWSARRSQRVVRLRSPDSTAVLAVSAPPDARQAAPLLRDAVATIRARYRNTEVRGGAGRRLGGRPAVSRVITGRNQRGTELRVLVAAAKGRRRAWLVEVFAADGAPSERLLESQLALRSLRLSG